MPLETRKSVMTFVFSEIVLERVMSRLGDVIFVIVLNTAQGDGVLERDEDNTAHHSNYGGVFRGIYLSIFRIKTNLRRCRFFEQLPRLLFSAVTGG